MKALPSNEVHLIDVVCDKMKGDEIGSMDLHTDDQKVQACFAKEIIVATVEGNMKLHVVDGAEISRPPCPIPVDLLQTCRRTQEPANTGEVPVSDPDIVCQPPTEMGAANDGDPGQDVKNIEALECPPSSGDVTATAHPLSAEGFQTLRLDATADIPMIDDDDDAAAIVTNSQFSLENPRTIFDDTYVIESVIPSIEAKTKDSEVVVGLTDAQCQVPASVPLKSALRKSKSKSKKRLRVSFHDTRIFYIDTDAETTAEPQLYTVQSLDLPLAAADYQVFVPTYDFLPSVPRDGHNDERSYAFEDAIVTLPQYEQCDDIHSASENLPSGSTDDENEVQKTEETLPVGDSADQQDLPQGADSDACAELVQMTDAAAVPDVDVKQPVQSLTEANLRQHEMLMEQDDIHDAVESETKEDVPETQPTADVPVFVPTAMPTCNGKTLSPPLKELSVDVAPSHSSNIASNWQVELSPLNSIPESETDSSNSSQDTMIMMTSEESRRNEEHIRHSTMAHQQACKQEEAKNNDTASTGSGSQDSDETLKCDESVDPNYRPAWMKTIDVEDTYDRNRLAFLNPRTSSQIRQLMERNAVRRSALRYSNTKKKAGEELPIEKQRQWQSHESLLDTIKQLTVEGEDTNNGMCDNEQQKVSNGNHLQVNGADTRNDENYCNANGPPSNLHCSRERSTSNLSLQDSYNLIAFPSDIDDVLQRRSQSTTNVDVPGDVRQWKIHYNRWNSVRGHNALNGMRNADSLPSVSHAESSPPSREPVGGGQFSDKEFFRTSLSNLEELQRSHYGDITEHGDELAEFVLQDSDRIERLRKRYSYTDGGDYDSVGAFNRRSSVRGIKPRFGSTNEILKQMQNQLQPQPLTNPPNGRNHMTWPYPEVRQSAEAVYGRLNSSTLPLARYPPSGGSSVANTLPVVQEEMYGTLGAAPSQRAPPNDGSKPYMRTRRGREGIYGQLDGPPPFQPPPYHPPPPAPVSAVQSLPPSSAWQYHYPHRANAVVIPTSTVHTSPLRVQAKDERGVPEGASSSPKIAFDSMYHSSMAVGAKNHMGPPSSSTTDNSGVVYYVMQV